MFVLKSDYNRIGQAWIRDKETGLEIWRNKKLKEWDGRQQDKMDGIWGRNKKLICAIFKAKKQTTEMTLNRIWTVLKAVISPL